MVITSMPGSCPPHSRPRPLPCLLTPAMTCPSCPFMSSSPAPKKCQFYKIQYLHLPPGASGEGEEDLNPQVSPGCRQPLRWCLELTHCHLVAKTGSAREDLGRDLGEPSEGCLRALKLYFPPNSPHGCPHPRGSPEATSISRFCPSFYWYQQGQRRVHGRWCPQPVHTWETETRVAGKAPSPAQLLPILVVYFQSAFHECTHRSWLHQQPAALRPAKMAPGFLLPRFPPRPPFSPMTQSMGAPKLAAPSSLPLGVWVQAGPRKRGAAQGRQEGAGQEEPGRRRPCTGHTPGRCPPISGGG